MLESVSIQRSDRHQRVAGPGSGGFFDHHPNFGPAVAVGLRFYPGNDLTIIAQALLDVVELIISTPDVCSSTSNREGLIGRGVGGRPCQGWDSHIMLAHGGGDVLSGRTRSLAAQGLSNQGIADSLVVSERTVGKHVGNILEKLHLANRTQAALYASREGFTSPDSG